MTPTTVWVLALLLLVGWQVYSVYSVKERIWCTFRRRDRTKIEKWARKDQRRIVFDGGWYHVEPDRTTLMIKWNPLPMWVRSLDFRWDSSRALHPDTFKNEFSPEERKQLDTSDEIRAFDEGGIRAMNTGRQKKGMLDTLFPIIVIVGMVAIGYMLWTTQKRLDMIGQATNVIQSMLGNLGR